MRIQVVKIVVREKGTVITLLMRLKPNKAMQCVELLKQSLMPAKFKLVADKAFRAVLI